MITIHDDYMSCGCSYVQRYLIPCHNVCAVIGKKECYDPCMFHIRWHKIYNYYHDTKYGTSNAKDTVDVLGSLLKITSENNYNDSGKFKGIYVNGTRFHNNLLQFSPEVWQINNN